MARRRTFARPLTLALRGLAMLAAATACLLAFRRLDRRALQAALGSAALAPVALAMAINLVPRTAARTRRTLLLLRGLPHGSIGFRDLFRLHLGGYAAGNLLFGPAEELFCATALTRRYGFRLGAVLSVQLLEKSLGVLSIAALALPILPSLPLPGGLRWPLALAAALALLVTGVLVAGRQQGASLAGARRRVLEAFGWLVASNLQNVLMVALCLSAVGVHLGPRAALLCFVVSTTCTNALPPVPAQVGILESAFVMAVVHVGVDPSRALAAAVLYHAAQVVPLTLAGLPMLARQRGTSSPCPSRA